MIIEFNGLPGTGKTTVANQFANLLKQVNVECYTSYTIIENRFRRYFSYFYNGSLSLYFWGMVYAFGSCKEIKISRLKFISLLIYYFRTYECFEKNNCDNILIIDQGVLQAVISIVHSDEIIRTYALKKIFECFKRKNIDIIRVDCENNIQLSYERIEKRGQNSGRLDICTAEERSIILKSQVRNFSVIRQTASNYFEKNIEIDTQLLPAINSKKIYEYVCNYLSKGVL